MVHADRVVDELRCALTAQCPPDTEVSLGGSGELRHCVVQRADRYCSLACRLAEDQIVYECYYRVGFGIDAMGIADTLAQAVDAAALWLGGASVEEMRQRFTFVDARTRVLEAVRDLIAEHWPADTGDDLTIDDEQSLHAACGDRGCAISCDEWGEHLTAELAWHGIAVARTRAGDPGGLVRLAVRWAAEGAKPSALRQQYPDLEFTRAAEAFEAGRLIEGKYLASWDQVAEMCADAGSPMSAAVIELIQHLRSKGFDRQWRAGLSDTTLLFSPFLEDRSRREGPAVAITPAGDAFEVMGEFGRKRRVAVSEAPAVLASVLRRASDGRSHPVWDDETSCGCILTGPAIAVGAYGYVNDRPLLIAAAIPLGLVISGSVFLVTRGIEWLTYAIWFRRAGRNPSGR